MLQRLPDHEVESFIIIKFFATLLLNSENYFNGSDQTFDRNILPCFPRRASGKCGDVLEGVGEVKRVLV